MWCRRTDRRQDDDLQRDSRLSLLRPQRHAGILRGYYFKTLHLAVGPATKIGQGYLNWQPIYTKRYSFAACGFCRASIAPARRPSISYDVPDPDSAGFVSMDEYYLFFGGLDHYDFKLLGKKEMYVPYNNNRLYTRPAREVLGRVHANPDDLRYELHRVWIVEERSPGASTTSSPTGASISMKTPGSRNTAIPGRGGQAVEIRTGHHVSDARRAAVILGSQFVYDFELGGYVYGFAFNDEPAAYKVTPPHPASLFTPDSMSARSVR